MFKRVFFLSLIFVATAYGYNPKDPIAYEVEEAIPSTVTTNSGIYTETINFKNQTGAKLVNAIQIGKKASPASEFTYSDGCSGLYLEPRQVCTVSANLTPVVNGKKTLQLVIKGWSHSSVSVPQPGVTTTAVGSSGATVSAVFSQSGWSTTMTAGASQPFQFTFTNNGSAAATNVATYCSGTTGSTITSCTSSCGTSFTQNTSCILSGSITAPTSTSIPLVVTGSMTYNNTQTASANSPNVTVQTGVAASVSPQTASVVQGVSTDVTFSFTNYTGAPITLNSFAATGTAAGDYIYSYGCFSPLSNGSTCTVTGVYIGPSVSDTAATLTGTLTYNTSLTSSATSTLTVTGTTTGARTIHFLNNCSFPVWIGMNSGAYTVYNGSTSQPGGTTKYCPNGNECPTGTTCKSGICYWDTYLPSTGQLELSATSGTATITIPVSAATTSQNYPLAYRSNTIFWSGSFGGRTNCTSSGCTTGDCGQGANGCQPGNGLSAPITQGEMTLQPFNQDTYDIEALDGFNLPVSVTPGAGAPTASGYLCSIPGDANNQGSGANTFSACDWSNSQITSSTGYMFSDSSENPSKLYWVSATASPPGATTNTCTTQADCSGTPNTICGISQVPTSPGNYSNYLAKQCGKFLGYMTAKQACAFDVGNGDQYADALGFQCKQSVAYGNADNLYACTGSYGASCYSAGAQSPCCGCINWQTNPYTWTDFAMPTSTTACVAQDTTWGGYVPTYIKWIKHACSNVYTYPYDDKSSTFNCYNDESDNTLSYTVTFCPGGNTGLPQAYTSGYDGRNG